jgi:ribosome-associated toxin RatA of RatAB toxin-antitoxin module
MARVDKKVLIERSAAQMFELVDCCENYPLFLPWCSGTAVIERTALKTIATLHINYHSVKSHFTTENDKIIPSSMKIRLIDGPFRQLEGSWKFTPLTDAACKVEFSLQYEFTSKIFEKIIGPVFSHIANTFVDSFVKRADQVYGPIQYD